MTGDAKRRSSDRIASEHDLLRRAVLPRACQIQDGDGKQQPFGEEHVGHIMVKGHPVMLAYENNPEETAKNFLNGWFDTGDLGYVT